MDRNLRHLILGPIRIWPTVIWCDRMQCLTLKINKTNLERFDWYSMDGTSVKLVGEIVLEVSKLSVQPFSSHRSKLAILPLKIGH